MKGPSRRPHVSLVWLESCPERGLAIVDIEVRETTQLAGEASPNVDITLDGVEAAAMRHSGLRDVTLWGLLQQETTKRKRETRGA